LTEITIEQEQEFYDKHIVPIYERIQNTLVEGECDYAYSLVALASLLCCHFKENNNNDMLAELLIEFTRMNVRKFIQDKIRESN